LRQRREATETDTAEGRAPYERPIDPGELDMHARRVGLHPDWIKTTMFLGSLAIPDGFPGAKSYYRFVNWVERLLFARRHSNLRGALVVASCHQATR
jgi:hypothetical protein